jgi:RNA polymerase sigma-70 factor (ECF subfamily)
MTDRRSVTSWHVSDCLDDAALVCAARDGDRNAFGGLYARYSRMVHGILLARVPATEVYDLVQDVFLHILPRLNILRDVARFGGWLAVITRNRANDYHRQSRTAAATEVLSDDQVEAAPANCLDQMEARVILEAIRALPQTYRETLILRLVEGMTGPEIATRTGLTPGSVRVNLHRGMQQLRERLAEKSGAKAGQVTRKLHVNLPARGNLMARWRDLMRKRNAP